MRLVEVVDMTKKGQVGWRWIWTWLALDLGVEQGDSRDGLQLIPLPAGNDQSGKCRCGIMISSFDFTSFASLAFPRDAQLDWRVIRSATTSGPGTRYDRIRRLHRHHRDWKSSRVVPSSKIKESERKREKQTSLAPSQKSEMIGCQIKC